MTVTLAVVGAGVVIILLVYRLVVIPLVRIEAQERWAATDPNGKKLRIYFCSPFRGPDERMNVDYARRICRELSLAGAVVFCPHIFFTQFLNDQVPSERNAGIENGQEIMRGFDEVWFGLPEWRSQMSSGMVLDEDVATSFGKHKVYALTATSYKKELKLLADRVKRAAA